MRLAIFFWVLLVSFEAVAQVSIHDGGGTDPNASSMLDVQADGAGVLIPRMTQSDRNSISLPATSLLIFQTDNTPGYYYNSGTPGAPVWVRLFSGSGSPVTGSGTATRVAFWNSASSLSSDADLYWDNSSKELGVGTTAPQGTLEVVGDIWSTLASDNSLRIRPGVTAGSQYGFADQHGNAMAFVNEQGTTNQAMVLGDVSVGNAATLFGVSLNAAASNPSTGAEAGWIPRFEVRGDGAVVLNAYTTNGIVRTTGGTGVLSSTGGAINLTSEVTGVLPVANGGSGASTLTGYIQGNGTSAFTASATVPWGDVSGAPSFLTAEVDPSWTGTANTTGAIGRTGNVGIGIAVGEDRLHVSGNIRHTGNMVSRGANYASTWMQFTEDQYGNSLILGAGGLTAIGAGESAGQVSANIAAGTEALYLSSDGGVNVVTNLQSGWGARVDAMSIASNGTTRITTLADASGAVVTSNTNGDLGKTSLTANANHVLNGQGNFVDATTLNVTGDNLGDHSATTTLDMNAENILSNTSAYKGLYFGAIYDDALAHSGAWGYIRQSDAGGQLEVGSDAFIDFYETDARAHRARFDLNTGRFGLNTIAPDRDLDVNGDIRVSSSQRNEGLLLSGGGADGNGWGRVFFEEADADNYGFSIVYNGDAANTVLNYPTNTFGITRHDNNGTGVIELAIPRSGNVGIGETSPAARLHIYSGGLGVNTGATDMLRLEINRSDHGNAPAGPAILFKDQDGNNATNEARIKMMTVNDTDYGDNDEAASNFVFETTNGGTASDKMIITGRGNVGIGVMNPTYHLHVNGRIGTNAINETSDGRLKKKITDLTDALEKVLAMRGVTYKWRVNEYPDKDFDNGLQYGLIAQELERVVPELVHTDKWGWKSIEYSHIVPLLIEAIKEQQAEIDQLKQQERRISILEASLTELYNDSGKAIEHSIAK